jgi:4-amino-4-deoxy-L-arabinose transferase-like glycosyltransferase
VWHDEGAWAHNARNKALWGDWRMDEWNPMYVAPVFTGLEYVSFRVLGVGLFQARLVSEVLGFASVLLLGCAVARTAGRRAGLMAAGLLATNYVYVMWNRAALLEPAMVAFLVGALYAYARALDEPRWGLLAGVCAWLAFFSKAAAAFFLPALALAAIWPAVERWFANEPSAHTSFSARVRAGYYTLAGLGLGAVLGLLIFVGPNWQEYWFYNWQMSVTRKPSYAPRAILDRFSWFPILHDTFTRTWLVLVVTICGVLSALPRWRRLHDLDRLLVAWIVLGVVELLVHDVGNERRYLFLVPAMCGMTALALGRDGRLFPASIAGVSRKQLMLFAPLVLYAAYVAVGPLARLPFLYQVRPGVRLSAAMAVAIGILIFSTWPAVARGAAHARISRTAASAIVLLVMAGDLAQFAQWAAGRTYRNYEALRMVAEKLPAGTLVHGKLANGLSLESEIRPVFVGQEFGNYSDRLRRDDIRYVLTYISPRVGYEGPVIVDVLAASPERRVMWTTPVAESACGCDAVALVVKQPTNAQHALPVLSLERDRQLARSPTEAGDVSR